MENRFLLHIMILDFYYRHIDVISILMPQLIKVELMKNMLNTAISLSVSHT